MAVLTKPGVVFKGFTQSLLTILDTLVWCDKHPLQDQPVNLVITSANDATHAIDSKHYANEAVDVRSKSFPTSQAKRAFMDRLYHEFGHESFTVLLENEGTDNEHFHLQKKKGT